MPLFDKIGDGTVQDAHQAVNDILNRADPLIKRIVYECSDVLHSIINRFDISCDFHFRIKPWPPPPPKEE